MASRTLIRFCAGSMIPSAAPQSNGSNLTFHGMPCLSAKVGNCCGILLSLARSLCLSERRTCSKNLRTLAFTLLGQAAVVDQDLVAETMDAFVEHGQLRDLYLDIRDCIMDSVAIFQFTKLGRLATGATRCFLVSRTRHYVLYPLDLPRCILRKAC